MPEQDLNVLLKVLIRSIVQESRLLIHALVVENDVDYAFFVITKIPEHSLVQFFTD